MSDCCPQNTEVPVDACDPECDESQISNFITSILGSITKTSVNGVCVWTLPCDLDDEIPAFPRFANEGALCYIYRILATGAAVGEANVGANVGAGQGQSYQGKTGVTLNFRTLLEGLNINLTTNADTVEIAFQWSSVPASKTAAGTAGQMAYDAKAIYICVGTNLWSRAALAEDW